MSPEERQRLNGSLFKPTSAFDTPQVELPDPADLVIPHSTTGPSPDEDWKEVSVLLEDVLFLIDDNRGGVTPLVELIEESLEEIERMVRKHV